MGPSDPGHAHREGRIRRLWKFRGLSFACIRSVATLRSGSRPSRSRCAQREHAPHRPVSLRPTAPVGPGREIRSSRGRAPPAAIVGTGRSIDLDPGGELKIKVLIGTASYRTGFGISSRPANTGSAPTCGQTKATRPTPRRAPSPPLEPVTIVERIGREVSTPHRPRAPR